jgi:hypothetical protein
MTIGTHAVSAALPAIAARSTAQSLNRGEREFIGSVVPEGDAVEVKE